MMRELIYYQKYITTLLNVIPYWGDSLVKFDHSNVGVHQEIRILLTQSSDSVKELDLHINQHMNMLSLTQ